MNNNKVFKVLFRGKILPGFDKETVIDNVYKITRIPKETITRKFFSGKTVVIRRADSQEYASRLQKIFSQAGIETYIDEIVETINNDEESDSRNQEHIDWEPEQSEQPEQNIDIETDMQAKPVYKKMGFIGSVSVLVLIIIGYLIFSTPGPVSQEATVPEKSAPAENLTPLNPRQILGLIKVTDSDELSRLSRFLPLFDIKPEFLAALKQLNGFADSISTNNPLYVFKTEHHKGIFYKSNEIIGELTLKQFQQQLDAIQTNRQTIPACAMNKALNLYHEKQTLLLSSTQLGDNKKDKNSLLINSVEDSIYELDSLFSLTKENAEATFNLYYLLPSQDNNPDSPNSLTLSAQNKTYWLSSAQQSNNNSQLLQHLGISLQQPQAIASLPTDNLYDLTLVVISQLHPQTLPENTVTTGFRAEKIITIKPSFSTKKLKDYVTKLDIEFKPQWLSGPFAMVTNNYEFNQQLKIELLAKGQNIDNLMEYSRLANIVVHSAYNKNKENILSDGCKAAEQSYFKDVDGEQEAYINDDFVTFHETTATKTISIEPGNPIEDLEKIVGEIKLSLPVKIHKKTVKNPAQTNFNKFENFALITHAVHDNTIDYQLLGSRDYFLTLRAYNKAGDILETIGLAKQSLINSQLQRFRQTFSQAIDSITIFYSKKNKSIAYPFTLKPEIIVAARPLLVNDAKPLAFDNKLDQQQLSESILADNPQWLGKNIATKTLSPFYISLFSQQELQNELLSENLRPADINQGLKSTHQDAVINIKTAITPLISQNMTAVKVILKENEQILFDDFITFTEKEYFSKDSVDDILKPELYLNSNSTFQFVPTQKNEIQGLLELSLPTEFKSHTSKFLSPGQVIKLGDILLKPVKTTRQQIQFEIVGNINKLVQVRLYNSGGTLISEALELKQVQKNKALLTLLYNDKIDSIKLILAHSTVKKDYPFSFLLP